MNEKLSDENEIHVRHRKSKTSSMMDAHGKTKSQQKNDRREHGVEEHTKQIVF
jgi:hypothetical protein